MYIPWHEQSNRLLPGFDKAKRKGWAQKAAIQAYVQAAGAMTTISFTEIESGMQIGQSLQRRITARCSKRAGNLS